MKSRQNNEEIRKMISECSTIQDVADEIGIHPSTLSHWMRKELTEDQHKRVLDAIHSIRAKG